MRDDLGDRMKAYEALESARRLDPSLPVYARIDGRGFSRFTRGMARPCDLRMTAAMQETARHLVRHTGARLGYTQSDEISLVWMLDPASPDSQMFFDAKVQKLCSVLAGLTTAAFTLAILHSDPEFATYADRLPHFDARVFNLPSRDEAANAFLWRELDAVRNAVSMTASTYFSAKSLHGVSVAGMRERLTAAGVDFEAFPQAFRRGTYLRRVTVERVLSTNERAGIPERHRPAADTLVTRTEVAELDLPPLLSIPDRVTALFDWK